MRLATALCFPLALLSAQQALGQVWDPLERVPRPNVLVALDASSTMNISAEPAIVGGCNGFACHKPDGANIDDQLSIGLTRIYSVVDDLNQVLPQFDRYFNFGAQVYNACGNARVVARSLPDPSDPAGSYARTRDLLFEHRDICYDAERNMPPEHTTSEVCLMPGCVGDDAKLEAFLSGTETTPWWVPPTLPTVSCTTPERLGQSIDSRTTWKERFMRYVREAGLAVSSPVDWPGHLNRSLMHHLWEWNYGIRDNLATCVPDPSVWDGNFGIGYYAVVYDDSLIGTVCQPGNWETETCLCNSRMLFDPTCYRDGVIPRNACGTVVDYPYRQQNLLCDFVAPGQPDNFRAIAESQSDNVVHRATNPNACRQNVALLATDSYGGHTRGVAWEADSLTEMFQTGTNDTNVFVLQAAETFVDMANTMTQRVSHGQRTQAEPSKNQIGILRSLVRVLNRTHAGLYSASGLAFDRRGTRAAALTFEVPGPKNDPALPDDRYFGRPLRLAWYPVEDDGALATTPLWETDWAQVAGSAGGGAPENNPIHYLCPGANSLENRDQGAPSPCGADDRDWIGPLGVFRDLNPRGVTIPANRLDRDGDGAVDNHPELRWGYQFGEASAEPLIVGRPLGNPADPSPGLAEFMSHPGVLDRPQVVYAIGNGYLHAFHAGEPELDARGLVHYDDDPASTQAGREIFRYRPPWLETVVNYDFNDTIQQPLFRGRLDAREARIYPAASGADAYATVLAMNQGAAGRGLSVLDVTNPFEPRVVAELTLAEGESASAEPKIYDWPAPSGERRVVIPLAVGTRTVHAWDIVEDELESITLPGGDEYWLAPVCMQRQGGSQGVDVCYILGRFGTLWRVEPSSTGFGSPVNVTPRDVAVGGGGREFWTRPVAFFDNNNSVGLAFGSGDPRSLIRTGSRPESRFYLLRDTSRRAGQFDAALFGTGVCALDGGSTAGVFDLGENELMSPPAVRNGVLAFTTYRPLDEGCAVGESKLFALRLSDCRDAFDNDLPRPAGQSVAVGGVVNSPEFPRSNAGTILVRGTERRGGAVAPLISADNRRLTKLRWLFWRYINGVF